MKERLPPHIITVPENQFTRRNELDSLRDDIEKQFISVAKQENRMERQLQQLSYARVLILDEIGYLPMNREEVSLFFRLLNRRYEKASIILTSNKGFADWGEMFGDHARKVHAASGCLHQMV